MDVDIASVLRAWPYDPAAELIVRRVRASGGERRIQLRLELGIIEMRESGRPDGSRPHGCASLLEYFQRQADRVDTDPLELDAEQCSELHREALQYYQRRISWMKLGEFGAAADDAEHNLAIMDLLREYAANRLDWMKSEQFRPYVLGHWTRARVYHALKADDLEGALRWLDQGIERMVSLFKVEYGRPELVDESEELEQLRAMRTSLLERRHGRPSREPEAARLRRELEQAVASEDFERAAHLRDRLAGLGGG